MSNLNINELTIGQAKELSGLFGSSNTSCTKPMCKIGEKVFVRTLTFHYIGEVVEETPEYIKLDKAVWVADSGRFTDTIKEGKLSEVELIGDGCRLLKSNMVDCLEWNHEIPTKQM